MPMYKLITMYRNILIFTLLFIGFSSLAQTSLSKEDQLDAISIFREVLSIPNDANYPDDIEQNILYCEKEFAQLGFSTQRLETPTVPLLLSNYQADPKKETVLVYLQIDGQPVDTSFWWQPNPYDAVLKEQTKEGDWEIIDWDNVNKTLNPDWRIFARSASDAKGPVAMFLKAIEIIRREGREIPFNLKVIMDFEEELGSPRLAQAVVDNREALAADHLIIFDGPLHPSLKPTLTFGARGIATVTLKVYGPEFPQHSGHYGNYVPNPALRLSQLLASLKDREGRVLVPGWYEGITIDSETQKILAAVPDDEDALRYKMAFSAPDKVGKNYQESIQYPSLNIRGMLSGWVGKESRTIVPALATAEIDIRTVKESDPEVLVANLKKFIEEQGYHLVDRKPSKQEKLKHPYLAELTYEVSYQAFRTELDSRTGLWLRKAMKKKNGSEPVMKRTSGGSIPISPFVNTLKVPAVTVPTVNPDNNQHSPNENLRLSNFLEGIDTMIAILTEEIE